MSPRTAGTPSRRSLLTLALAMASLASPCQSCRGADEAGCPAKGPYDEVAIAWSARDVLGWGEHLVSGKSCRVSPVIDAGAGNEINHYRIIVDYEGAGSIRVSVIHSTKPSLAETLTRKYFISPLRTVKSGQEITVSSTIRRERYAWVAVNTEGDARITDVRFVCWRGKGTVFGHAASHFSFDGSRLPYRLMYPRNYDPAKSYPLVVSVSGSGGVGTDNVRNMENVILGRYLFTRYYLDDELACFSLVPQIPTAEIVPKDYFPHGPKGKPTPIYHPDWSAVNENSWYTQASLALVASLIADERLSIDPDRVYMTGFSYGGKAVWEFLKAGRDVFAAGACGAGWPIGYAHSRPTGPILDRLKLEVQRYRHIPVHIFAAELDQMRYGSSAVDKEIRAQGGKSTYVEFPKIRHVQTASRAWGNRKYVKWLFEQNRKNNPPAGKDPFPRGVYPGDK